MAKTSDRALSDVLKLSFMEKVAAFLAESGETVLRTASGQYALPVVDAEGNDKYLTITFSVPTGSRSGEPYDGYAAADFYAAHCEEQAQKAAARKAKAEKAKAEKTKVKGE